MKRSFNLLGLFLLFAGLAFFVHPHELSAQGNNPWSQLIPRAGFGYGGLLTVEWSPLNGQLAAVSERGFQFYDEALTLQGERRFESTYSGMAVFSPDMAYVAMEEEGGLIIRNTATWEPVLALGSYGYPSWSHDGRYIGMWLNDSLMRVWDVQAATVALEVTQLISNGGLVQWSPDSQVVAVGGPGAIVMVRTDTGDIVRIHAFESVVDFEWSADGKWFLVSGREDPPPVDRDPEIPLVNDLMLVDAVTGEIVRRYDLTSSQIAGALHGVGNFVSISPNSRLIAARLNRWEPAIGEPGDEDYVAAHWVDVGMGVWELETGGTLDHDFSNLRRPLRNVSGIAWSPDGAFMAAARDATITTYDAHNGDVVGSLRAYVPATDQTEWTPDGNELIVARGLWDVGGSLPIYEGVAPTPPVREPLDLSFIEPHPDFWDFEHPPYRWEIMQVYEDRGLLITYEIDIEYPGTPEYEDDIPPDERWVLWNIPTQERWEEYSNLGKQTAWLYDLPNADERANGNTYFNVLRTTRFVVIGDDELMDLRDTNNVKTWFNLNRYEWREVWFSPTGDNIWAYDTDGKFKALDPITGQVIYETVPASRYAMEYAPGYSRFSLVGNDGSIYVYDAKTGEILLNVYPDVYSFSLLWSPDLNRVAIGGDNNVIIIYDIPTKARLSILRGHKNTIATMAWNPACDLNAIDTCKYVMVSSDVDGRVLLWGVPSEDIFVQDIPTTPLPASLTPLPASVDFGQLEALWTYVDESAAYGNGPAESLLWSSRGIRINGNTLYDEQLQPLDEYSGGSGWYSIEDYHPNGLRLERNGTVHSQDDWEIFQAGYQYVNDAAFASDGLNVFTAEGSGTTQLTGRIREWSIETGEQVSNWGGGSMAYNQIALAPNGSLLATATVSYYGSGGRVQLWSMADHTLQRSLIGHTASLVDMFWNPATNDLITAGRDGSIRVWDVNGNVLARWHTQSTPVVQVEWSPTKKELLVSADDNLYVLDAITLGELRRFEGVGGRDFAWSPSRTKLGLLGRDSIVRVVDYATGQLLAEKRDHMPAISQIRWHPNGSQLALARQDGSIVLLNGVDGTVQSVLRAYGQRIRTMEWDPAGTRLLLDLQNGPIEIIDGTSGALLTRIENQWRRRGVWWSPDGFKVAFGTYPDPNEGVYTSTSLVWIYSANAGTPIQRLSLDWDDYIWYWELKPFALNWSPDSRYVAAFYGKDRLRVWDLHDAEGRIIATHEKVGSVFSLGIWQNDALTFWTTTGHGQLQLASGELDYVERDGLPERSLLRSDGKVLLAYDLILDFTTFYPLQAVSTSFTDASWHPSCWSSECSAVLAVAYGSNVVMFGYVPEEGE